MKWSCSCSFVSRPVLPHSMGQEKDPQVAAWLMASSYLKSYSHLKHENRMLLITALSSLEGSTLCIGSLPQPAGQSLCPVSCHFLTQLSQNSVSHFSHFLGKGGLTIYLQIMHPSSKGASPFSLFSVSRLSKCMTGPSLMLSLANTSSMSSIR